MIININIYIHIYMQLFIKIIQNADIPNYELWGFSISLCRSSCGSRTVLGDCPGAAAARIGMLTAWRHHPEDVHISFF